MLEDAYCMLCSTSHASSIGFRSHSKVHHPNHPLLHTTMFCEAEVLVTSFFTKKPNHLAVAIRPWGSGGVNISTLFVCGKGQQKPTQHILRYINHLKCMYVNLSLESYHYSIIYIHIYSICLPIYPSKRSCQPVDLQLKNMITTGTCYAPPHEGSHTRRVSSSISSLPCDSK